MMLTARQRFWLQKAWDEGSLITTGLDRSRPAPRLDIMARLVKKGWLRWQPAGLFANQFVLTDEGRKILKESEP